MRNNQKLIIAVLLILIISWLDYQYFMEERTAVHVSDNVRKAFHVLSMLAIAVTGAAAWRKISKVIYYLWTGSYAAVFLIYLLFGVLNWFLHFGDDFLNEISRLRMFFCSPMPFGALFVIYRLLHNKHAGR